MILYISVLFFWKVGRVLFIKRDFDSGMVKKLCMKLNLFDVLGVIVKFDDVIEGKGRE